MRFSVSDTAEYGDYVSGPARHGGRQADDARRALGHPERSLRRAWIAEYDSGGAEFARLRQADRDHQIEQVGRRAARPDGLARPGRGHRRPGTGIDHRGRPPRSQRERGRPMTTDVPVRIFDTTLRDGEQAPGAGLTVSEKLEVARQLARLKVDVIEAGFPTASPGDFEAVQRIAKETKGIAVAGLARCRDGDPQRGVEALLPAEKPHLHLFIATSDIHLEHKLRHDPRGGPGGGRPLGPLRARGAGPRRRDRVQRRGRQPHRARLPAARLRGRRRRRRHDRQHPRHGRLRHPCRVRRADPQGRGARRHAAPSSPSTATTTWAWPRPTRWPPSRPARARSRSPSTASASAPATPRSRRSSWRCARARRSSTGGSRVDDRADQQRQPPRLAT